MFTVSELLELAVKIEHNGEAVYRAASAKVGNQNLVVLLEWIAAEEARHADVFKTFREEVRQEGDLLPMVDVEPEMLASLLGEQSFSLEDADFSKVETIRELLTLSVEFERDTVLFYELLRRFVQEEASLAKLDEIIAEENRHIARLTEFLDYSEEALP